MSSDLVTYSKKGKTGSGTKKCIDTKGDDLTAIVNVVIEASTAHMGRPCEYPPTTKGLDDFIQKTIDFFEYVNTINADPENEKPLIPDVEAWAVYLGITRVTLWNYSNRGGEWKRTIEYYKNCISAIKKQLAMSFRIPPMVYVFDACNNHGYVNTNQFTLTSTTVEKPRNTALDEEVAAAGLVWNETTKEFEPID